MESSLAAIYLEVDVDNLLFISAFELLLVKVVEVVELHLTSVKEGDREIPSADAQFCSPSVLPARQSLHLQTLAAHSCHLSSPSLPCTPPRPSRALFGLTFVKDKQLFQLVSVGWHIMH